MAINQGNIQQILTTTRPCTKPCQRTEPVGSCSILIECGGGLPSAVFILLTLWPAKTCWRTTCIHSSTFCHKLPTEWQSPSSPAWPSAHDCSSRRTAGWLPPLWGMGAQCAPYPRSSGSGLRFYGRVPI